MDGLISVQSVARQENIPKCQYTAGEGKTLQKIKEESSIISLVL
jgi:hypothetical protein